MDLFEAFDDELEKIAGAKRLDRLIAAQTRLGNRIRSGGVLPLKGTQQRLMENPQYAGLQKQIEKQRAKLKARNAQPRYRKGRETAIQEGYRQPHPGFGTKGWTWGHHQPLGKLTPTQRARHAADKEVKDLLIKHRDRSLVTKKKRAPRSGRGPTQPTPPKIEWRGKSSPKDSPSIADTARAAGKGVQTAGDVGFSALLSTLLG